MLVSGCFKIYRDHSVRTIELLEKLPADISSKVVLAWEKGGLLTPAWTSEGELSRLWTVVIAHQAAVAVVAFGLALRLSNLPVNEGFTRKDLAEAALVHDAFKRREFEITQAAKKEGREFASANREAELTSAKFLMELGFAPNVVSLSKATGDIGLERMTQPDVTVAEQIIFYADCCASNDQIVGYKQRFDDLKPHFQPGGRYEAVDASYQKRWGMTHREKWDEVVLPLQKRLAAFAGFHGDPNNLYAIAL